MRYLAVTPLLALLGCDSHQQPTTVFNPRLENIQVVDAIQGIPATVKADVVIPGVSDLKIRNISFTLRSTLVADTTFAEWDNNEGNMNSTTGGKYQGTTPPLDIGPYELQIKAVFRPFNPDATQPGPDTTIQETRPFIVGASSLAEDGECFTFEDESAGTAGWTFNGYFNGSTSEKINVPGCPESPMVWFTTGGGTLTVPLGACIPPEASQGFWRFNFESPNVAEEPAWQNITGVMMRMASNRPVQIWPLISVDDEEFPFREPLGDTGEPDIHYPIEGGTLMFRNIYSYINVNGDDTVTGLVVRVFGEPTGAFEEASVNLSVVCPLHDMF